MIYISIIEDHENYRNSLVQAIQSDQNFEIAGVYRSAEEALERLPTSPPDIAIVDIQLADISGIQLIEKVKGMVPETQFLMCSSYQNTENIFSALKAGASGYIVKGSTALEIQNAVRELHQGGSPMSPYIARKVISHYQKSETNDFGLSKRELEVLNLLSKGLLYKEISDKLAISTNTVKNHCKNIYKRLHVQNKTEALNKFNNKV
ncbi:MAG: response regulator transcription factor [Chryseobacterium sp.]|nr:MAG: response regulator transcription factor [Chryseobacterium sp.]